MRSHIKVTGWHKLSRLLRAASLHGLLQLCLELLFTLALRNRDRIGELWPLIHDFLTLIMNPEVVKTANPLVQRAALGVLRVAQRLLPYKEDASEALLRSLQLLPRMNPNVAWELAEPIAVQVCEAP